MLGSSLQLLSPFDFSIKRLALFEYPGAKRDASFIRLLYAANAASIFPLSAKRLADECYVAFSRKVDVLSQFQNCPRHAEIPSPPEHVRNSVLEQHNSHVDSSAAASTLGI